MTTLMELWANGGFLVIDEAHQDVGLEAWATRRFLQRECAFTQGWPGWL